MMDLYKTSQTKPIFEATVYHVFLRIMVTPLFGWPPPRSMRQEAIGTLGRHLKVLHQDRLLKPSVPCWGNGHPVILPSIGNPYNGCYKITLTLLLGWWLSPKNRELNGSLDLSRHIKEIEKYHRNVDVVCKYKDWLSHRTSNSHIFHARFFGSMLQHGSMLNTCQLRWVSEIYVVIFIEFVSSLNPMAKHETLHKHTAKSPCYLAGA